MKKNRIEQKFCQLKEKNKKARIVFISAGFPNLEITARLVLELENSGSDIIELGVPFSDPLADGRLIQKASQLSLEAGTTMGQVLSLVKSLRAKTQIPICLMSYYNSILRFGKKRFALQAHASGVDGIIIPDLPPEEDKEFIFECRKRNIDTIFFISPTTSLKRVALINRFSRGFIYYVSLTGVTGARKILPPGLLQDLIRVKRYTQRPLCVGFGISHPNQVKDILSVADGVIVGSAVIERIQQNLGRPDLVKRVGRFVRHLSSVQCEDFCP